MIFQAHLYFSCYSPFINCLISSNFANAIRTYYKAKTMGDSVTSQAVLAWLKGEKISLSLKKLPTISYL